MYTNPQSGRRRPFLTFHTPPERNMTWVGAWHGSNTPRRWDSHGVLREGRVGHPELRTKYGVRGSEETYPTSASVAHSPFCHSHHLGRRLLVMMPAPSEAEIATCQSLAPAISQSDDDNDA